MRNKVIFPLIATFLFFSAFANGQSWTGIIDPSRAIAWQPGIPGGVPNRTTVCTTLNPGATAGQINSAIASCPSGQVVFLNTGTYNLSSGIDFAGHNNVTLRGAGPTNTIVWCSVPVPAAGGRLRTSASRAVSTGMEVRNTRHRGRQAMPRGPLKLRWARRQDCR